MKSLAFGADDAREAGIPGTPCHEPPAAVRGEPSAGTAPACRAGPSVRRRAVKPGGPAARPPHGGSAGGAG